MKNSTYNTILGSVQNKVGTKGGISITAFEVLDAMDASPGFKSIQGDIKNAYNEVEKENVMEDRKWCSKLDDTVVFMQTLLAYVSMGNGTHLFAAPFKMEEGDQ